MAEPGLVRYKPFDTLVDAQADGTLDNRMICFIDGVMHRKIDGDILPIGTYIGSLASYPALGDSASLYVDPTNNKLYLWDSTSTSYIEFSKPSALPENQFLQVHKSFIISKDKIELIEGNRISIQDHNIPIGKFYKINVIKMIK